MPKGWWTSGWYPSALINLINAKKVFIFNVLATQSIFSFALLILNIPYERAHHVDNTVNSR